MSIEVIGAGFGRTGTTSLKAALEALGFDACYHMVECFKHPSHTPSWEDAVAGRPVNWDELFRGYRATVDWPGCSFYRELLKAYPDAKVLLSVRDPDRWYQSTLDTIYRVPGSLMLTLLSVIPAVRRLYRMVDGSVWEGTFGGRFEDRAHAIDIFERHNEEVIAHVPPERLLVYEVKDGWEPLCEFFGVPVPEGQPFPHLNDAKQIQRALRWGPVALLALLAGGVGAVAMLFIG